MNKAPDGAWFCEHCKRWHLGNHHCPGVGAETPPAPFGYYKVDGTLGTYTRGYNDALEAVAKWLANDAADLGRMDSRVAEHKAAAYRTAAAHVRSMKEP